MNAETHRTNAACGSVRGLAKTRLVACGASVECRRTLLLSSPESLAVASRETRTVAVTLVVLVRVHATVRRATSEGAGSLVVSGSSALESRLVSASRGSVSRLVPTAYAMSEANSVTQAGSNKSRVAHDTSANKSGVRECGASEAGPHDSGSNAGTVADTAQADAAQDSATCLDVLLFFFSDSLLGVFSDGDASHKGKDSDGSKLQFEE
ncbi:hypothetical protein V5799_004341 [Amblyomma americanum]|uniref:Uncharacterized protein n=1 Tax=Amblyomma americanum TaxID=6943 RepID=A0AAQ4D6D8_AMBAM